MRHKHLALVSKLCRSIKHTLRKKGEVHKGKPIADRMPNPDSAPDDADGIRKKYQKISYIGKEDEEEGCSLSINITS